jgi:hypothetical protein
MPGSKIRLSLYTKQVPYLGRWYRSRRQSTCLRETSSACVKRETPESSAAPRRRLGKGRHVEIPRLVGPKCLNGFRVMRTPTFLSAAQSSRASDLMFCPPIQLVRSDTTHSAMSGVAARSFVLGQLSTTIWKTSFSIRLRMGRLHRPQHLTQSHHRQLHLPDPKGMKMTTTASIQVIPS